MSALPPVRRSALSLPRIPQEAQEQSESSVSFAVVVTDHLAWARTIAHGVRQTFHFQVGSQEEQDLESTAYLAIVELAPRFDVGKVPPGGNWIGAFRGWAAVEVRARCRREARRLRNGGTYNTRREFSREAIVVKELSEKFELIDPRSLPQPDEEEPEDSTPF